MNEQEAILVLNAVGGLTNTRIKKLMDTYGSARAVLSVNETELARNAYIPSSVIQRFTAFQKEKFLDREMELMQKNDIKTLTFKDEGYPESLSEIPDAPIVLYVKGNLPENIRMSVSIVGSRKASLYGQEMSERFAMCLAELGIPVISGMARGIDTHAHRGALKAQGETVAVLGCGLYHVYPPENAQLFKDIARQGAVISEFAMETPPVGFNFPRRNRIISGLSLGVVVMEATEKSGALITADAALEQGKEVFALPGKIDNPSASGTNNLIKQGAKLITCVDDILEELKVHFLESMKNDVSATSNNRIKKKVDKHYNLTESEQLIFDQLSDRPIHIDELTGRHGPTVVLTLLQLELKKIVKQLPGKRFIR